MKNFVIVIISIFILSGCAGLSDYEINFKEGCILNRSSAHSVWINCGDYGNIDKKVFELNWDDRFVFAKTHPVNKRKYPNNPDNSYKIPDLDIIYYWIIDTKNKKQYGPLENKNIFDSILQELGYTDEVNFMTVEELEKETN